MPHTVVADHALQPPEKKLLEQKVRNLAMLADDGGTDRNVRFSPRLLHHKKTGVLRHSCFLAICAAHAMAPYGWLLAVLSLVEFA